MCIRDSTCACGASTSAPHARACSRARVLARVQYDLHAQAAMLAQPWRGQAPPRQYSAFSA
eukprot:12369016-Alexandrium_andersonii.AAC.1